MILSTTISFPPISGKTVQQLPKRSDAFLIALFASFEAVGYQRDEWL